jgi:hypothetical protein
VQKRISIFLISILLFSQTELHELFRLPSFVQHYLEHKSANKDITLSEFIADHYFKADNQDQDNSHNSKLPFKNYDCFPGIATAYIPQQITIRCEFMRQEEEALNIPLPANEHIISRHIEEIWQPPRA